MRRVLILILMVVLLVPAANGLADPTLPGPDALGLYFDAEATQRDLAVAAGTSFELFLILTNPTMNALEGWEAAVILTNGNSVMTTVYPAGSQALSSGPSDWAVTMLVPMPCNTLTKLAVFTVMAATDEHAPIYLGNIAAPSLAGDYPTVRVPGTGWSELGLSSGDPSLPVADVNSKTPSRSSSWGALKSLFR